MVQHRAGHAVVYSIAVPEVRDLLLAARRILRGMIEDQQGLRAELAAELDADGGAGEAAGEHALEVAG